ncbi:sensor histidine kinase [Telluria beijingensis]|uniref:sensor histidine kinase n=1 Tax=Telluria beijingensis TaxID=3068633 RepID=UPI002795C5C3|nr:histidine kinase [Massilia sp. REN29]
MGGGFWARRSAALYLAAWLMLGLMLAGLLDATSGAGLAASLVFALPLVLVYAAVCGFSAYYLCRAYPLGRRSTPAVLAVFFASAVFAALLWCSAASAWAAGWQWLAPRTEGVVMSRPLTAAMFGVGVLLYGMSACAHYLALEFERARGLERRELELKLLAQDAELRMLRTQIDPHFLFNSLNSISALTAIDAGAARDMTLQLAGFFRHTLGLEAHRKVTLLAEVELVERFVAIEQVRFGPRLAFECQAGADAEACLLPPMILQPLVENAVKHGIGQLLDGGVVRVRAERAGSQLKLRVENDVDPDASAKAAGGGIGLANVRERLRAAYGIEASVHATRVDNLFRVDLVLPAEVEQ